MNRFGSVITLGLTIGIIAAPSSVRAQAKDEVIEGQIKIGSHKFKLEAGSLYQFEVKGKDFVPSVFVAGNYLNNTADFVKDRNTFRAIFLPKKSHEYTVTVLPQVGFGEAPLTGVLDYTLTFRTMKLDEKPLLSKEDKLTADDEVIKHNQIARKTHFKAYTIKLKAGQTCVIDMVAKKADGNKIDPYLYLENPKQNIVAQDDDGGGFPNARIVYRATQDAEFRILASGLGPNSDRGDYTLTVRTVKDDKEEK